MIPSNRHTPLRGLLSAVAACQVLLGAAVAADWQPAAPVEEIQRDWMFQDHGLDTSACFKTRDGAERESAMVDRVLAELAPAGGPFRQRRQQLLAESAPGSDPRWKALYLEACAARRRQRLARLVETYPEIVFTKHYNLGGSHYAYTEDPTDAQSPERERTNADWRMGSALCLMRVAGDGTAASRILLEEPDGLIRDPDVSYDGRRIAFSMRDTAYADDYHLYEMQVSTGKVRQLTFGPGFADIEPAYLPGGNILFNSTRCMQITDCFWTDVGNLYLCDGDGRFLRRVGFDQVHTNYPKPTEDGRVIYTRWDYNDRGQIYPQPLFVMNCDGTGQTEYYGNNSWFPTSILHARDIPGTQKVIAIASGHHSHQRGKLILIDRRRGNQEAEGVQLVAPPRETPAERIDSYGQDGDQFQYPYPVDATRFLVTYDPVGSPVRKYARPYGIYFMDLQGRRELLAWDPRISCNQPVPLARRREPQVRDGVDFTKNEGAYYIQDIYAGLGLEGIEPGTIKKVRVVALEYRAAGIRCNYSRGPGGAALASTPVSIGNGCWDVKVILGDAPVDEHGSAYFKIPARTPVYFQALDDRNRAVATMRSWSTLQPGETFACVGCHEGKNAAPQLGSPPPAPGSAEPLQPFHGSPRGFSFENEIQPILDAHCVSCHFDRSGKIDWTAQLAADAPLDGPAFSLMGNTVEDAAAGRHWAESYLALTQSRPDGERPGRAYQGQPNRLVHWITSQSAPEMLPPYYSGSPKSGLIELLAGGHAGVKLSAAELDTIAAWIDLGVPYCGDYLEANAWTDAEKAEYAYYQKKRDRMAEIEKANLLALVSFERGSPAGRAHEAFDCGGPDAKKEFLRELLGRSLPLVGRASGEANGYRNLAFNPAASQGEPTSYPHASTNSEYRGLPHFAARNVIDGSKANTGHGPRFPSWGPNKRTDLWCRIDFGRTVEVDKVVLTLRADFPHDGHWHSGVLEFSDGTRERIALEKTAEPQAFSFSKRTVAWLRLTDLVEEMPPDWCGLTEWEAWGRDLAPQEN